MSGYKIRDQSAIHFITFAVIEWIVVFTRKQYADIVVESLKYCQTNKGLIVYGSTWCSAIAELPNMLKSTQQIN